MSDLVSFRFRVNLHEKGDKLFTEFKGAFTENYVAQELANQHNKALLNNLSHQDNLFKYPLYLVGRFPALQVDQL